MIKDIIEKNENTHLNDDKINKLKDIIPECFDKDGRLDLELLKKELNTKVDFTKESFELNFLGKSYAKMISGLDTETVIEPDIEHNNLKENKESKNIFISGDNLDALKHLQKTYQGMIKCIYIDPLYNTGSDDFGYEDNFKFDKQSLTQKLDIDESEAERILNMTSSSSSSHSAWLTFMLPRLYCAQSLLKDNGVIFISIDDNEQANLKLLCNSIFGEENFVAEFIWQTDGHTDNQDIITNVHEYIMCYAKNKKKILINNIVDPNTDKNSKILRDFAENSIIKNGSKNPPTEITLPIGFPCEISDLFLKASTNADKFITESKIKGYISRDLTKKYNMSYPVRLNDMIVTKGKIAKECKVYSGWMNNAKLKSFIDNNFQPIDDKDGSKVSFYLSKNGVIYYKRTDRKSCYIQTVLRNLGTTEKEKYMLERIGVDFSYPKPYKLVEYLISMFVSNNDIILDFFAGSGTTAHSVYDFNINNKGTNLSYILVQKHEIDKKTGLYIDETAKKRLELTGKQFKKDSDEFEDFDYGFKHYTLKETSENLLNKLEEFKPELINESYNLYKEYGIETILETWKLKDGYEFSENVLEVNLDGYVAYKCNNCLYFILPSININNIESLLEKYDKESDFICDKLIIFGYSFSFNEIEMIKNNIKQVKNYKKNIDIKVYERY